MQVRNSLQAYGVRPRLQTLWRDAHGLAVPSDNTTPSGKAKKRQRKSSQLDAESEVLPDEATADALASTHMEGMTDQRSDFVSPQQSAVFAICNSYKDLLLPNHPYPTR